MRKSFIISLLSIAIPFMAMAGSFLCESNGFPGHVQGITADKTGIYWSFYDTIVKTDFKGKTIGTISIPKHAGDLCAANGKIYVSVTYYDKKMADDEGTTGWVYVYDSELKFIQKVAIPDTPRPDGITFLDGKFYIAGDDFGKEPHPVNTISVYDGDFKFEKKVTVDIEVPTQYGAQTLNAVDGKILAGFYAKRGMNSVFLEPKELKKVELYKTSVDVGMAVVPAEIAKDRKIHIVARLHGERNNWGSRADVYEWKDGNLIPTDLEP